MEAKPKVLLICQTEDGRELLVEWLNTLDRPTRARIRVRIDRLEDGLFGDVEPVGEGVSELRMDFGPGYRIYFALRGDEVHLLLGGDKQTQVKDIRRAKELWRDHE
jgi:putative addiction module killer protein